LFVSKKSIPERIILPTNGISNEEALAKYPKGEEHVALGGIVCSSFVPWKQTIPALFSACLSPQEIQEPPEPLVPLALLVSEPSLAV